MRTSSSALAILAAAKRAHFRLSEQQILQQYGMPSEAVVQQNGSVLWTYRADGESSGFVFMNSLVTQIW